MTHRRKKVSNREARRRYGGPIKSHRVDLGSERLEQRLAMDVTGFTNTGVAADWTVLLSNGGDSIYMQRIATGADLRPESQSLIFANTSSFLDQGPGTYGEVGSIDSWDSIYVTNGEAVQLVNRFHDAYPLQSGSFPPPPTGFPVTTQFVLSRQFVDETDSLFGSIFYNGNVWSFTNNVAKNSVPGPGDSYPSGGITISGPSGATIVRPTSISFSDAGPAGDASVFVTWDGMPVVTSLAAGPTLSITYDANNTARVLTPATKDAPAFYTYNQDYQTDGGRWASAGGIATFTVPVTNAHPGGIIAGTLRGQIDVDADGTTDYTFAPAELFAGGNASKISLCFNEFGDASSGMIIPQDLDTPTASVSFLTGDDDANFRNMVGYYNPFTGEITFEFRNPATGGLQALNGPISLPYVRYGNYSQDSRPSSATFFPGLDIQNEVFVDLLTSGSSINVESPILQVAGRTVAGADIALRATNININAPVEAIDVLSAGKSLALVNSFASAFPGGTAAATGYAVVRSGQVQAMVVPPGFGGQGYDPLSPPAVTIAPPPASPGAIQATATAIVQNGSVVGFAITSPGNGYTTIPTVTIAAPPAVPPLGPGFLDPATLAPPLPPVTGVPAIAEQMIVDASVAAQYFDIRLADDPNTTGVTRGKLAISPSGSLSGARAATASDVTTPAKAVFVQAANSDVFVEGVVFASEQTYLLQSAQAVDPDPTDGLEPAHDPFIMSTRSLASGAHTGQIRGDVLAVTMGNDAPTAAVGSTAVNIVDLETKVDSVRIKAATREGEPLTGPFPYELTLRDEDSVVFDAVAASGRPIQLSAGGDVLFNASLATASDVFITASGSFAVSAPVTTTKGRIAIEGTSIAVNNSLRVLDPLYDPTIDDISLRATAGDIFLTGVVSAVNNIDLLQINKNAATPGKIYGPQRIVSERLTVSSGGSVNINTNVSSLSGVAATGFAVREADDIAITSLRSGGLVSLRADGVDPRFGNPFGGNAVALSAVLTDVVNLEASAPNGSVTIVNDTAKTTVIGNAQAIAAGTAASMAAARNVSIRSTAGGIDVLDAPLAGGSGMPVRVTTTAPLPSATYAQNVPGTRASTLTATVNGSINDAVFGGVTGIDGVTSLRVNDRVLVRNQAAARQNGVYVVTRLGSPTTRWQLTRAAEADTTAEFQENRVIRVLDGLTQAGNVFTIGYADSLGTTPISADVVPNRSSVRRARVATTGSLQGTYDNAAATITSIGNQSLPLIDGVSLAVGDRVLVRSGTHTLVTLTGLPQNVIRTSSGIYEVTSLGGAASQWVLTRTDDANETAEIPGYVNVAEGSLATALNGGVYRVQYDSLGVSPLAVTQAVVGTDIGGDTTTSIVRFVVSSSAGTNAAAGSLGKMVSLRQANDTSGSALNPQQETEFRVSSLVLQRINLSQQLPAISAAFAIDGAARYAPSGVAAPAASRLVVDGSRIRQTRTGLPLFNGTLTADRQSATQLRVPLTSPLLAELRTGMVVTGTAILPGTKVVGIDRTTGILTLTPNAVTGTGLTTVTISPELNGFEFLGGSSGASLANVSVGGFANGAAVKIAGGVGGVAIRDSVIGQDASGARLGNRYGVLVSGSETAVLATRSVAGNSLTLPLSFAVYDDLYEGLAVSGPGIAAGAKVASVDRSTRLVTLTPGGVVADGDATVTFATVVSSATIAGNTIVANSGAGVRIQDAATGVILVGNTIGTAALANTTGIELESSGTSRIGANPILPRTVLTGAAATRSAAANTVTLPASFTSFADLYVGLGLRGAGLAAGARIAAVNAATRTLTLTTGGVTTSGTGTVEFANFVTTTRFGLTIVLPAGVAMENLFLGQGVSGIGIRPGAKIAAIDVATRTITLSSEMTATGTTAVAFTAPNRNVVQFNRLGMLMTAGANTVTNTDVVSSTFDGIRITGGRQTIGTSTTRSARSNAIHSNGGYGINILVSATNPLSNHVVQGNFLGTRSPGTVRLPNELGDMNPAPAVDANGIDANGNLHASQLSAGGGGGGGGSGGSGTTRPPSTIFPLR